MNIQGQAGELHMTLQIKRKETGETEEIELVGYLDPEQLKQLETEQQKEQ